ncbi:transglycosylase SLT domain-containing protein [Vibrio sp. 10N.261.51.F12]|uniref:transglycosylase SLT domain-containing protein n=1 Tax=Vibrio sp. 10N.261.51.F12 TaxID=3229679 RepID=UPI00354D0A63
MKPVVNIEDLSTKQLTIKSTLKTNGTTLKSPSSIKHTDVYRITRKVQELRGGALTQGSKVRHKINRLNHINTIGSPNNTGYLYDINTVNALPLTTKAREFLPLVRKASHAWGVDVSLILAIIHVESYFEPKALSHAPAYGLMQVMKSGAVAEIIERYYPQSQFTTEQLYTPSVNIDIGTAYLNVLQVHYLQDIRSPISRQWLAIAAYNCGPANLQKYFKRNNYVESFSHTVNQMSDDAIIHYLTTEFPIDETRTYVTKVLKHQQGYHNVH